MRAGFQKRGLHEQPLKEVQATLLATYDAPMSCALTTGEGCVIVSLRQG
jgi:hypothetical protein